MGLIGWLAENWFDLLQTVAITTGLYATVYNLRADRRERMVQTQFAVTAAHREIWSHVLENPALARILNTEADLAASPVTLNEELLVQFLILHLRATYKARRSGMDFGDDKIELDMRLFFALPIPRHVWDRSKEFQDQDFVEFVDANL